MSVEALLAVAQLGAKTSHAGFRVLMVLAEHADRDGGNSWPSVDRIAERAQTDEKTVRRCLATLQADGLVSGQRGGGRGNTTVWTLLFMSATAPEKGGAATGNGGMTPPIQPENRGAMPSFMAQEGGRGAPVSSGKGGMTPEKGGMVPAKGGHDAPRTCPEAVLNQETSLRSVGARADEAVGQIDEVEAPSKAVSAAARRAEPKATRLPDDWMPGLDGDAFAAAEGLDPRRVAASFRDYWRGQPGAKGRKLDWQATWRNWCRREAERLPANRPASPSRETASDRRKRELNLPSILDFDRRFDAASETPALRLIHGRH